MGRPFKLGKIALAALTILVGAKATAQSPNSPADFDSHAIENVTDISDGLCSNRAIGISYQLPDGMRSEDAAAMRMVEREGELARTGIGPEAGYFLFGYAENRTAALVCGAAGKDGQVLVMASSATALQSLGPDALQRLVEGLAQALGKLPGAAIRQNINGTDFERADAQGLISPPGRGKHEAWGSFYATKVNSYVVMWSLVAYSKDEWEHLVTDMNSVKVSPPQPITALTSSGGTVTAPPRTPAEPDFQNRLNVFLAAWLEDRDRMHMMAFVDRAALSAPPLIGSYCDGWYKKGAPPNEAAQFIAQNLMGVPGDFASHTSPSQIFGAWDRLPPQWTAAAANDVSKDHFLVAHLDEESVSRMFSGVFANSNYENYLKSVITKRGDAYWVVFPEVMPDGDMFVIFTLWQKTDDTWRIFHIDVVCQ